MRCMSLLGAVLTFLIPTTSLHAQAIIAQSSGLTNPNHVIDFGANLYPNFTNITTQFAGITVTHARYYTTGVATNLVGGFLTNDFSGAPDTLKIRFASPIRDLSFVYHQIGTSGPSAFRAMLGNVVVDSFSNASNQSQTNNYFGFTNIVFDELQLDFVGDFNVDTLAFNDANQPPIAYCTAGTTTNGCVPAISGAGTPSVSAASGFTITVNNVEGQKQGILFYGLAATSSPWATGSTSYKCVSSPTQRMGVQNSGGTTDLCDGVLTLDWNAYRAANPGALGNPFSAGQHVFAQGWFRDPPAPKTTNLSNALEYVLQP